MYEGWSDEALMNRFDEIASRYKEMSDEILPKLAKISIVEKELFALSKEIESRGFTVADSTKP